jgi:hypothetical protein
MVLEEFPRPPAFFAKMIEIRGETVAEVNHGRRQTVLAQILTDFHSGDLEMARIVAALICLSGAPQRQRTRLTPVT